MLTHVSCGFFITEHVGVGGHDGRPGLLRDAGRLRGSFALVHQLLHGVCDALVTGKSAAEGGSEVKTGGDVPKKLQIRPPELPSLEGLLSHSVILRLSVFVEVGPQPLWILLICCCKAQLKDALEETN